jgi:hypothetical protein
VAAVDRAADGLVVGNGRGSRHPQSTHEPIVGGRRHDRRRGAPVGEDDGQQRVEGSIGVGAPRNGTGGGRQEEAGFAGMVGLGHGCLHARSQGEGGPGRVHR